MAVTEARAGDRGGLLRSFVDAFRRGIRGEMEAMRERLGATEVPLSNGRVVDEGGPGRFRYAFDGQLPGAGLAAGDACSLRTSRGDQPVTTAVIEAGRVELFADQRVDLASPLSLVVAPWFLYQRLIAALETLAADTHAIDRGLTLFGKGSPRRSATPTRLSHDDLNASQRAAVKLCTDSDLAFVWGPPGTGKTTTLVRIIEELSAQGKTILLASTTNAALDQVLARAVDTDALSAARKDGAVVRLGKTSAPTFGTLLEDVVRRRHESIEGELLRLDARAKEASRIARHGRDLLERAQVKAQAQQSLFGEPEAPVFARDLDGLLAARAAAIACRQPPPQLAEILARRVARFERLEALCIARQKAHRHTLRASEADTVRGARVVLATLAHVYLSPLLGELRFDVVIVEEASMAVLPALFYAACLGREKIVVVGDPRQLEPIVQSDSAFVRHVLGRNIFDVAIPRPDDSEVVALLDVQYRMHPSIGGLVGDVFYGGRLQNGHCTGERAAISAGAPYPGQALIVVNTAGSTRCERAPSGSRVNHESAQLTANLALEAAGGSERSVAVITPYRAQAQAIRKLLAAHRWARNIECSTIHRFQGQERDVVIIDLVDAAPLLPGKLLAGDGAGAPAAHLLNVSLSRALGKLILVADVDYFEAKAPASVVTAVLRRARNLSA